MNILVGTFFEKVIDDLTRITEVQAVGRVYELVTVL